MLTEAVKLEMMIWNTHGFWPKTTNRYKLFLYNCVTAFLFVTDALLYVLAMGLSVFSVSDLQELSDALYLFLTLFAMIPKYLTIICNRGAIRRILEFLDSDELVQEGDDEVNSLIKQSIRDGKRNSYTFLSMATCSQFTMFLVPLLSTEERMLPFRAYYGLEDNSVSPWYEWLYFYQVIGCFIHCNMNVAMDTLPCAVLAVAGGQLDVLAHYIRQLGGPDTDVQKEHAKLQGCIRLHLNINKLLRELESIFKVSWFVQFLLSGIVICITGFQASVLSPLDDWPKYLSMLCYLSAMVFMAFMTCKFGNEIILKSAALQDAAFSCQWPDADPSFRKKISFLMEYTKKPIRLYAGNMLELSLSTFSSIINSAYRYYAVLQHMQNMANHN